MVLLRPFAAEYRTSLVGPLRCVKMGPESDGVWSRLIGTLYVVAFALMFSDTMINAPGKTRSCTRSAHDKGVSFTVVSRSASVHDPALCLLMTSPTVSSSCPTTQWIEGSIGRRSEKRRPWLRSSPSKSAMLKMKASDAKRARMWLSKAWSGDSCPNRRWPPIMSARVRSLPVFQTARRQSEVSP